MALGFKQKESKKSDYSLLFIRLLKPGSKSKDNRHLCLQGEERMESLQIRAKKAETLWNKKRIGKLKSTQPLFSLRRRAVGLQKQKHLSDVWFQDLWRESGMEIPYGPRRDRYNEPFSPYIVDCISFFYRYVIESDGPSHDKSYQILSDRKRDSFFRQNGFEILRIKSHDHSSFLVAKERISEIRRIRDANISPEMTLQIKESEAIPKNIFSKTSDHKTYSRWGESLTRDESHWLISEIIANTDKKDVIRTFRKIQRSLSEGILEREWRIVRIFAQQTFPRKFKDTILGTRKERSPTIIPSEKSVNEFCNRYGESPRKAYFWLLEQNKRLLEITKAESTSQENEQNDAAPS